MKKDTLSSFHGIKTMNDKEVNYKYKIPICLNQIIFTKYIGRFVGKWPQLA